MFGAALYFAENSSKCNQYVNCPICGKGNIASDMTSVCSCTSESKVPYVMILCRVAIGNPCK